MGFGIECVKVANKGSAPRLQVEVVVYGRQSSIVEWTGTMSPMRRACGPKSRVESGRVSFRRDEPQRPCSTTYALRQDESQAIKFIKTRRVA